MQLNKKLTHLDQNHYYSLDIIRIFAAIIVLLNHFASYSSNNTELTTGEDRAYKFLEYFYGIGAVGVEIFFVISGLVIASSVSHKSGLTAALNFIYRRGQRIIPTLWMSSSVSLIALCSIDTNWFLLVKSFIRSNLLFPIGPYIDGVVWSLIVEAFFYLVVSATIMTANRNRLVTLAISIALISAIYNAVLISYKLHLFDFSNEQALSSLNRFPYKVFLLRYGVFFSLGIFIFNLKESIGVGRILFIVLCCTFCILEIIASSEIGIEKALVTAFIWIASVIIILIATMLKSRSTKFQFIAFHKSLKYLGNLSYPLYLNHYTLGIVLTYHFRYIENSGLKFVICLSAVFFTSAAILHMERYVKRQFFQKNSLKSKLSNKCEVKI